MGRKASIYFLALTICFFAVSVAHAGDDPTLSFPLISTLNKSLDLAVPQGQTPEGLAASNASAPEVRAAQKHDLSLPLTWMPILQGPAPKVVVEVANKQLPPKGPKHEGPFHDPVAQHSPFSTDISVTPEIPATVANFEGVNNRNGVLPPDTNGDIGPNHYVQTVNLSYAVYNRTGGTVLSPRNTNTIWTGFGGPCETTNHGDPIVLYDQRADRWLVSQFSLSGPFYQCIAISQTGDPTGAYYRYQFLWSNTYCNDYPHFGIWPDGYYMSANEFSNCASFAGAGAGVFERSRMLQGLSAQSVIFHAINDGGQLPSDMDGPTDPPAGSPNLFADYEFYSVHLWKFSVNWSSPGSSTFTSFTQVPVATFDTNLGCSGRSCIPQPGTSVKLDAIADRYMYRLAYRNFGAYDVLLANHTVDADSNHAGVRWYEIRNPRTSPSLYQQGTYAPDANHRWMGSVAMDGAGNIALGYSVSSSSVYPSIRYTGRLASDPLGTLPQGEGTIIAGGGSQTHSASRWGDYSSLSVDPQDDCTFWYTTEYIQSTGSAPWRTRIGSFKFPNCGGGGGCNVPSGFANNTATDLDNCADTGVQLTWNNPSSWGDTSGTRTHDVLRNGVVIAPGLSAATTSYTDTTGTNGVSYTYTVRHNNGCGSSATTAGASAADDVGGGSSSETATLPSVLQAKNGTSSSALLPAFSIASPTAADISWSLSGNTDVIGCAEVRLRAPGGAETTLKAAGQADLGSANVLGFYSTYGSGTYTIVLEELGGCGTPNRKAQLDSASMTVQSGGSCGGNNPPVAAFTYSCTDLSCNFTDASTDDGTVVSWSWNFGDGGASTSQNPSHTFGSSGTYNVTLMVTDNGGLSDSDSKNVFVSSGGGEITLSTNGYTRGPNYRVDLNWSGASTANVDVYRNTVQITTTTNSGAYTDNLGKNISGSFTYKICDQGTSNCSNDSTVTFP